MESEDLAFEDILKHVDRESEHFVVRLEAHHTGRQLTIVESHRLTKDEASLQGLAHKLKEVLGTSGGMEEGRIVLHGDHRDQVRSELVKLGFAPESIELI